MPEGADKLTCSCRTLVSRQTPATDIRRLLRLKTSVDQRFRIPVQKSAAPSATNASAVGSGTPTADTCAPKFIGIEGLAFVRSCQVPRAFSSSY
jgi:hypothetical protein